MFLIIYILVLWLHNLWVVGSWLVGLPAETAGGLIALVSAAFGALGAMAAFFTVVEMREDRRERNRPYLVVDFEIRPVFTFFRLRNLGSGPAFGIELEFNPSPPSPIQDSLADLPRFQHPIPILPPGDEIREPMTGSSVELLQACMPKVYNIRVTYSGEAGFHDSDLFMIDVERLRNSIIPGKNVRENMSDIAKYMKSMDRTSKSIVKQRRLIVQDYGSYAEGLRKQVAEMREESAEDSESQATVE